MARARPTSGPESCAGRSAFGFRSPSSCEGRSPSGLATQQEGHHGHGQVLVCGTLLSMGIGIGVFQHSPQGQLRLSLIGNLHFPKAATPKLPHSLPTTYTQVWQAWDLRGLEKEWLLSSLLCKDTQRPEGLSSNIPFGASGLRPAPISAGSCGLAGGA